VAANNGFGWSGRQFGFVDADGFFQVFNGPCNVVPSLVQRIKCVVRPLRLRRFPQVPMRAVNRIFFFAHQIMDCVLNRFQNRNQTSIFARLIASIFRPFY